MTDEIPQSVRIRTSDENKYRYDAIQEAANYYQVNKSDAVVYACDDVTGIVQAAREVLNRDDLTTTQKQEIAAAFSSRGVDFDVDETISLTKG